MGGGTTASLLAQHTERVVPRLRQVAQALRQLLEAARVAPLAAGTEVAAEGAPLLVRRVPEAADCLRGRVAGRAEHARSQTKD